MNEDQQAEPNVIVRGYVGLLDFLAGSAMLAILLVMTVQVIMRYAFSSSLIWAEEFCRYLLVWMTFLLVGLAFRRGHLMAIDTMVALLPPRLGLLVVWIGTLPVLVFLWVMLTNGYSFASRMQFQTSPVFDFIYGMLFSTRETLGVSVFWLYLSVPVGCGLLIIHLVLDLWNKTRAVLAGRPLIEPQDMHIGEL